MAYCEKNDNRREKADIEKGRKDNGNIIHAFFCAFFFPTSTYYADYFSLKYTP